jgi:hypothetical protein
MRPKMNIKNLAAIIFCILALAVGVFYLYGGRQGELRVVDSKDTTVTAGAPATSSPAALSESIPTTQNAGQGKRLYKNAAFHFSLLYPQELVAKEYIEQGDAISVLFQDPNTGEGFQIYIIPYGGTQIDTERFRLDEPSGVIQEQTEIRVDATRATMFFGKNSIMGDTREVWFIKNGFLYEVATYKELDSWLGKIMQSWKFL